MFDMHHVRVGRLESVSKKNTLYPYSHPCYPILPNLLHMLANSFILFCSYPCPVILSMVCDKACKDSNVKSRPSFGKMCTLPGCIHPFLIVVLLSLRLGCYVEPMKPDDK